MTMDYNVKRIKLSRIKLSLMGQVKESIKDNIAKNINVNVRNNCGDAVWDEIGYVWDTVRTNISRDGAEIGYKQKHRYQKWQKSESR